MDKGAVIIEMPELTDEMVGVIRDFLQDLVNGFERHYYPQLTRIYRKESPKDESEG